MRVLKSTSMNVIPEIQIGICAYNEEHNIGTLLDNLLTKQKLPLLTEIIVVCSGCTDSTPDIVQRFAEKYGNIKLIIQEKREGKASALRLLFQNLHEKATAWVLVNADTVPAKGAISCLLQTFLTGNTMKLGAVASRPIPLYEGKHIVDGLTQLVWSLHHSISLIFPKLSGELCVIRPGLLRDIPSNLATDEPFLEMMILKKGYRILYQPQAIVYIRVPATFREYLKHRRRIWVGHLQISHTWGYKVSTMNFRYIIFALGRELIISPKKIPAALMGIICEVIAYLLAYRDFRANKIHYVWEILKSTKGPWRSQKVNDLP